MIFTRSMSAAANNANATNNAKANTRNASKAANAKNVIAPTPAPVAASTTATATISKANEKLDSKQRRAERRRLETLVELSELGAVASAIIETKRQRRPAQHPDLAFYRAFAIQTADAGKRGGLVTRSMHRYERDYNGK